jgi:tRNA-specific 2-thiouridylase
MYYTLGQRAGLGLGGRRGAAEAPWYAAAKDLARNVLIAVQGHDHPLLMSRGLVTGPVHWIAGAPPAPVFDCSARFRYRQRDVRCQVLARPDGRAEVAFDTAERAVTPGQYAVFYDAEVCLGGGVIDAAIPLSHAEQHRKGAVASYN